MRAAIRDARLTGGSATSPSVAPLAPLVGGKAPRGKCPAPSQALERPIMGGRGDRSLDASPRASPARPTPALRRLAGRPRSRHDFVRLAYRFEEEHRHRSRALSRSSVVARRRWRAGRHSRMFPTPLPKSLVADDVARLPRTAAGEARLRLRRRRARARPTQRPWPHAPDAPPRHLPAITRHPHRAWDSSPAAVSRAPRSCPPPEPSTSPPPSASSSSAPASNRTNPRSIQEASDEPPRS